MYCSQCAHKIVETDVYCPKCAKPVAAFNFTETNVSQVEPLRYEEVPTVVKPRTDTPLVSKPKSIGIFGKVVAIAIVGLLAVIAIALWTEKKQPNNVASTPINPTNQNATNNIDIPSPSPTIETVKTEIVNTTFPVPARRLVPFMFGAELPFRLTGGFVTYGGSRDITAIVVDEQNFELYRKNYPYRQFYKVDRTDKAKIAISLPPGRYYLIFDNRHSFMTDKSVAAEIYVQYSATPGV